MFCGSVYGFKMNGNGNNGMEIDKYSINSEREQREQLIRNLLLSEFLNEPKLREKDNTKHSHKRRQNNDK